MYSEYKLNKQGDSIHPWSTPFHVWNQIDGKKKKNMETVTDFILGGSKITVDGNCSHEIERRLLLGRKARKTQTTY